MKTRIFLFILLCFILANINAQDNKDDLSNSKELTGIWEINLGDSYETVKAVMQKRGWTVSSMPSNEKKAIKNRESLGLDPRPTYTFKKQSGTFGKLKVSYIKYTFFQNQLYNIQICFVDINNKWGIESSHLQNDLQKIYSLTFENKQTYDWHNNKHNATTNLTRELYHSENLNKIAFNKVTFTSLGSSLRITIVLQTIDIYKELLKNKAEEELHTEFLNDIKTGNELNGIFEIDISNNKDTAIAAMSKRKWVIKSRDRKKNEKIIFSKSDGTFALLPVYEIELFFEDENLNYINITLSNKPTSSDEGLAQPIYAELHFYELMEQIKNIYNLKFVKEGEYITKNNSYSSESNIIYTMFNDSNFNTISFMKCTSNNNNAVTVYGITISKSIQSDDPEKNDGRLDKIIEDL